MDRILFSTKAVLWVSKTRSKVDGKQRGLKTMLARVEASVCNLSTWETEAGKF